MRLWIGLVASVLISGSTAMAAERVFVVDFQQSSARVFVFKKGLLKSFGHDHELSCAGFEGRVLVDWEELSASSVQMIFPADGLSEQNFDLSEKKRKKVETSLRGPQVLDVQAHPNIVFRSTKVEVQSQAGTMAMLSLSGDLKIREQTRSVELAVQIVLEGDRLRATGSVRLLQTDFGIEPFKAALGTIAVKDEIRFDFDLLATAAE